MRKTSFCMLTAALVGLAACDGGSNADDAARQFALDFAQKVSNHQVDSLTAVYPDVAKADSLALSFIPDSVRVTAGQAADAYEVAFNDSTSLSLTKDSEGRFTVTSSRGIFAYPAADMAFAKATGQWDGTLTDAENAIRMADKDFRAAVQKQFIHNAAKKLLVKGKPYVIQEPQFAADAGIMGAVVVNKSEQKISGSDYKVHFKIAQMYSPSGPEYYDEAKPGQDINPGEELTFTCEISGYNEVERAYVNTTLSDDQFVQKYFHPTGKEWEEYVAGKK